MTLADFVNDLPTPGPDVQVEGRSRWLVRTMLNGKFMSDIGEFDSEQECRDFIAKRAPRWQEVRFPIRVHELTVTQAFQ